MRTLHTLLPVYDAGVGDAPQSEMYACSCGEWELQWVQEDVECSDRPDLFDDVLPLWSEHVNEAARLDAADDIAAYQPEGEDDDSYPSAYFDGLMDAERVLRESVSDPSASRTLTGFIPSPSPDEDQPTYLVTAVRDGEWWAIKVDVPERVLWTQAANPAEIGMMARDVVAVCLDVPADSFALLLKVSP